MKKVYLLVLVALFAIACEKTPEEIAVTSVSLSQPSAEMIIGETLQLQVSISPSNATDKSVIWGSSKQSVAMVSNTGLVTAVSEGTSTITATAGGKSATCQVTVSKGTIAVSSIELNKTELSLVEGESETLVATVKPDDATDKTVQWESSDKEIATINGNGKVSAVKEGEANITARAGDKSASCKVVVAKKIIAVEYIELSKTTLELVEGESEVLTANVLPDNATDKTVTWSTSDASIATVEEGKVIAIKEGEATITASAGGTSASCSVTVKRKEVTPEAVDLGLSVKWASFNVGATKPEEYGDYFAWGETEPKSDYSWATYKWCNGSDDSLTRYCPFDKTDYWGGDGSPDNKTNLADYDYEDDAARANWGGKWRMPIDEEIRELMANCSMKRTALNDVNGYMLTSKRNGNSIFLPAAGYKRNSGLFSGGGYWSSTVPQYGHPGSVWRMSIDFGRRVQELHRPLLRSISSSRHRIIQAIQEITHY